MLKSIPAHWLPVAFPFLSWWPKVNRDSLKADSTAALTGSLIVLPQGVAFATIAGLPPEYGLYAAMVPAIIAALFGSSWHMVSGPTTAISIALFASLNHLAEPGSTEFIRLALTLTFLTGLFQLILGLARMGVLVNFISHTVIIGFTAGAAILIAGSQIKVFFGLDMPRGIPFYEVIHQFILHIKNINGWETAIGVLTLLTGILAKRYLTKFPYMIVAMVVASITALAVNTIYGVDVTHIKTVGALPASLPPLSLPDFSHKAIMETVFPAMVITMLALTEAVSISRSIAIKSEQRIDSNQEFIGQGLSNLAGSFFSGFASSGSFNRSGVNYAAGARTPLASIFAAVFLALIVLMIAPLASYLPTAAMAGILFLVAWDLIDFHHINSITRTSRSESLILWVTLIGTLINLEKGIFLGITLSLIIYLYRTSRPSIHPVVPVGEKGSIVFEEAVGHAECPQLHMIRINGSIFFGAVDHIQASLLAIDETNPQKKFVLITGRGINFIDIAGAEMLAQEAKRRKKLGGAIYFYRLKYSVYKFLHKGDYLKDIGEGAFFHVASNLTHGIYHTLDPEICKTCTSKIFPECHGPVLPDGEPWPK
jgi:sulfate permease, SulP family